MRSDEASLFADRRGRAIEFPALSWSSASSSWWGFRLERAEIAPFGILTEFAVPEMLIGLCVAGRAEIEIHGREPQRRVAQPGTFALLDRGDRQSPIAWQGAHEILYVRMSRMELQRLMGEAFRSAEVAIVPQYAVRDSQIERLLRNMQDEALTGCRGGKIYAESLCLALASYVFARYGTTGPPELRPASRLSASQSSRLKEYIQVNLKRDLSLAELAQTVGFSSHHFSQLFKNTFGTTPHRYLLRERIREGQRLLTESNLPISDLALEIGFSDQSHFTQAFRKLMGSTPKRYRRAHGFRSGSGNATGTASFEIQRPR